MSHRHHSNSGHTPRAHSPREPQGRASAGRRHRRLRRIPGPLRVVAVPVMLLVALAFAFGALRENARLRRELAELHAKLAGQPAATPAGTPTPPSAATLAPAQTPLAPAPDPVTNRTAARPPPAPSAPSAAEAQLSPALREALREALAIRPNAAVLPLGRPAPASRKQTLAPFADELVAAYTAMSQNENEKATALLAEIAETHPHWPYAFFYLAITTRDRAVMDHAKVLFGAAEQAGLLPLEGTFYWGLAMLLTGENQRARAFLTGLATRCVGVPLLLGPVYGPTSIPPDVQRSLDAIPGLPDIRRIEPLLAASAPVAAPDSGQQPATPP